MKWVYSAQRSQLQHIRFLNRKPYSKLEGYSQRGVIWLLIKNHYRNFEILAANGKRNVIRARWFLRRLEKIPVIIARRVCAKSGVLSVVGGNGELESVA